MAIRTATRRMIRRRVARTSTSVATRKCVSLKASYRPEAHTHPVDGFCEEWTFLGQG
jgi:hypothetical protein